MTEAYFELAYYRDFIIPAVLSALALIIIGIVALYNLFCKWNDKRHKK